MVEVSEIKKLLLNIIYKQGNEEERTWMRQQEEKLHDNLQLRSIYLAFSSASRFIGKTQLNLSEDLLARADRARKGFQPQYWNLLQCARAYLVLMIPHNNKEIYEERLTTLFDTADMNEQVALYRTLPLFPFPEIIVKRATEGIRTNITDVFDAIALHNPFPADFLNQQEWNQMLLKAVFMQRPLYRIYGSTERANPELAKMLIDFAHERWAANRKVWPELWRFVGPFLELEYISDIKKCIESGGLEKKASLLACANSEISQARQLLDHYPEIKKEIESGRINWTTIGEKCENEIYS